jgi:hypothetical protein
VASGGLRVICIALHECKPLTVHRDIRDSTLISLPYHSDITPRSRKTSRDLAETGMSVARLTDYLAHFRTLAHLDAQRSLT